MNEFEDPKILEEVYQILSSATPSSKSDWWLELPEEVKKSILKSREQSLKGETFSHEQVRAEIKQEFGF